MLYLIRDFLHLLATAVLIGGMLYSILVLMPSLAAIDLPQRGKFMGVAGKRFSFFAWGSVVVLLITGYLKRVQVPFYAQFLPYAARFSCL